MLHVLGPGCSAAHVVVQAGDAVFVGDLINPDNHAWLELGTIDEWLKRLEEIRAMKPVRIYPGRGKAGGIELIDRQAAYLRFVQRAVQARNPSGALNFVNKFALTRQIEAAYPDLGYPLFMRDGLEAVWRVEAAKKGPEPAAPQRGARESM
jgi:glyoxylase-like metal-dependent hydrolase (beta-lactamase superfamily II)